MRRLPRQLVSCVTAAFVLACNVLCACGGHSPVAAADADDYRTCHQTCEPEPAQTHSHSHCAGHRGHHGDHRQDGGEKEQPARHPCGGGGGDPKDHGSGCQHCGQIVAVPNTKAKAADDLTSHPCLAGFAPPPSVGQPVDPGCLRGPVLARDLSPPKGGPTLLSLYCALTL